MTDAIQAELLADRQAAALAAVRAAEARYPEHSLERRLDGFFECPCGDGSCGWCVGGLRR